MCSARISCVPSSTIFLAAALIIFNGGHKTYGQTMNPEMFPGAPPIQYSSLSGPAFLTNKTKTVRAVAGLTAVLPCEVRNVHNYTVSWVRGSDIRLLTNSVATYTSDGRFVASHSTGESQWLLKIHYVKLSDSGSYICQVSTTPPISLPVNLTVYEAIARVLPGIEVHVQTGSRLKITCEVEGCPPPALLSWARGSQPLLTPTPNTDNFSTDNGTTHLEKLTLERLSATPADSGTYSCTSTCTKAINVTVHVLRGEELAAMQHHNGGSIRNTPCNVPFVLLLGFLLWQWSSSSDVCLLQRMASSCAMIWGRTDKFAGSLTTT